MGLYRKIKVTVEYETRDGKTGTQVLLEQATAYPEIVMESAFKRPVRAVYDADPESHGRPSCYESDGPLTFKLSVTIPTKPGPLPEPD